MSMKELKTRIHLIRFAMATQIIPAFCGFLLTLTICGEPTTEEMVFGWQLLYFTAGAVVISIAAFVFLLASRYEYLLVKKYNKLAKVRRANGIIHVKDMKAIGYSMLHA